MGTGYAYTTARRQEDSSTPAIEELKLSNAKGPHFADPLEGWGEVLMAKNQSHLALPKFAEAEKYAPSWGRLRTSNGAKALELCGQARRVPTRSIQKASTGDLTAADESRAELTAKVSGRG